MTDIQTPAPRASVDPSIHPSGGPEWGFLTEGWLGIPLLRGGRGVNEFGIISS